MSPLCLEMSFVGVVFGGESHSFFSSLRLLSGNENVRCLMDMKYSPRIIHFSASPKPSDFLFGQDYHHLHDRTLSQRSQERPPVVKWVENVEHVYAAEVIEPQKKRHDKHLEVLPTGELDKCLRCNYPLWKDKKHTRELCEDHLTRKRGYLTMRETQEGYDKMSTRCHVRYLYDVVWPSMVWAVIQMVMKQKPDGGCPSCLTVF